MSPPSGVRFAPSPTGAFHLGNLRTAWISWRWARALGEPWVVRFEDIDQPRVVVGAQQGQLRDMEALGLAPDQVAVQSEALERHWQLFRAAVASGVVYPCVCSRKEVQAALAGLASAPHGRSPGYSGRCRAGASWPERLPAGVAWRFKAPDPSGAQDFIIARSSVAARPEALPEDAAACAFVPAYHWACAIDDFDGRYRLLVRASDLAHALDSQRALQAWLARVTPGREGSLPPAVFHTALVTQDDGHRLEKRTAGVTLAELRGRGIGPGELLQRFAASFSETLLLRAPEPGAVLDEGRATLTLSDLGL